jgi:rare lipoprotein A
MNLFFVFTKFLVRPGYVVLFCAILFIVSPTYGQQNSSTKANDVKTSPSRVIYGLASFYADKFNGRQTANGEIFSQAKLTCACNILPLGTWISVTNVRNGKSVIIKTNDRLHPKMRRLVDLSKAAAKKLGYTASGVVRVKVVVIGKNKPA